jgi:hypothetical protein
VAGNSLVGITSLQIIVNLIILVKGIAIDIKRSWLRSKIIQRLCEPRKAKKSIAQSDLERGDSTFGISNNESY